MRDANIGKQTSSVSFGMPRSSHVGDDIFTGISSVQIGTDHVEPTFVRRRNERERDRVKCVNEGYTVLKEHLPIERKNKRVSKVEILRFAIDYIRKRRETENVKKIPPEI
jgi:achaete-scute complex protein